MTTTQAATDWWAGVPALGTALTRREADRLTALACAVRITPVTADSGGISTEANRAETAAEHFADWLGDDDVDDAAARRRRICLCLTVDLGARNTHWKDILATAKWMLRFITDR
jgi:hypothetical protein